MRNAVLFAAVATCIFGSSYLLTDARAEYFWHVLGAYACGVVGMACFIALKRGSKAEQIEAMAMALYQQVGGGELFGEWKDQFPSEQEVWRTRAQAAWEALPR